MEERKAYGTYNSIYCPKCEKESTFKLIRFTCDIDEKGEDCETYDSDYFEIECLKCKHRLASEY